MQDFLNLFNDQARGFSVLISFIVLMVFAVYSFTRLWHDDKIARQHYRKMKESLKQTAT
ncbi:MAG: hypothetical protein ACYDC8_17570 [Gammaproteobacteria bacterium]